MTLVRMLLKSCAMPPVRWPMASIFCAWRSCASSWARSSAAASAASRGLPSTSTRDEHVAGAAHGLDHGGLRRVGLDLAAQTRDADIDRAVERLPFAVARQGQQLV